MVKNEEWREIVERIKLDEHGSWRDAAMAIKQFFPALDMNQLIRKARTTLDASDRAKSLKCEDPQKAEEAQVLESLFSSQ